MPFLYVGNLGIDYNQDTIEKDFTVFGRVSYYNSRQKLFNNSFSQSTDDSQLPPLTSDNFHHLPNIT